MHVHPTWLHAQVGNAVRDSGWATFWRSCASPWCKPCLAQVLLAGKGGVLAQVQHAGRAQEDGSCVPPDVLPTLVQLHADRREGRGRVRGMDMRET